MRLLPIARACTIGLAALSQSAQAGTATATFTVSITVIKECTVTPPGAISFGIVGATTLMASSTAQSAPFIVLCSAGTPYTIAFTSSNDLPSNAATHQMKGLVSNANVVQYNLADITSGATNLLPLGGALSLISAIGTGVPQTKTVQATLLGSSNAVSPDTYSDVVTMTVTY